MSDRGKPEYSFLQGALTAILTPFDGTYGLALDLLPPFIEFQRQAGIDGLVVGGTNGEATSLTVTERQRLLETAIAHRKELLIVAGTGAACIEDAVALTRHAAASGADAALVLPPFYYKSPTTDGLVAWFHAVLNAAELPVLLYSIPQCTMVPITTELLDRLRDHPRLAGLKDSAGDWMHTRTLFARYPELRIFAGSDRLAARLYRQGGAGCISGGANAFPEIVTAVRDACRTDPLGETPDRAQERLNTLAEITAGYPPIAVNKCILAHRGLPSVQVRPPLIDLSPAQEEQLVRDLQQAGLLPA